MILKTLQYKKENQGMKTKKLVEWVIPEMKTGEFNNHAIPWASKTFLLSHFLTWVQEMDFHFI